MVRRTALSPSGSRSSGVKERRVSTQRPAHHDARTRALQSARLQSVDQRSVEACSDGFGHPTPAEQGQRLSLELGVRHAGSGCHSMPHRIGNLHERHMFHRSQTINGRATRNEPGSRVDLDRLVEGLVDASGQVSGNATQNSGRLRLRHSVQPELARHKLGQPGGAHWTLGGDHGTNGGLNLR